MTQTKLSKWDSLPYPHEYNRSPLYIAWGSMKTRCNNPKTRLYHNYGGRGIRVCERWDHFANFLDDMGQSWAEGLTLDRIDVNGDYTPENCRWATWAEQQNNKTNNNKLEYRGEAHTLNEWARRLGIKPSTMRMRYYNYGWDIERCLTTPTRRAVL